MKQSLIIIKLQAYALLDVPKKERSWEIRHISLQLLAHSGWDYPRKGITLIIILL